MKQDIEKVGQISPEVNNNDELYVRDQENQPLTIPKKTINSILNQNGITFYHVVMIIICGLMISCDGISMNLLFLMTSLASQRFNITSQQVIILNSTLFLGVILSAAFNVKITQKYKRTRVIIASLAVLYTSNMISAWIINVIVFAVLKFTDGLCVGILISNAPVILCEILPSSSRFKIVTSVYSCYSLGLIYTFSIFLIFFPGVSKSDFSLGIVSVSQVYLITLILALIFLEESPRLLLFSGESEAAFEILMRRFKINNLTEKDKIDIIQDIRENLNNKVEASFFKIFSKKYILLTVLLILIWIINNMVAIGIYSILPNTLTKIEDMYSVTKTQKTNKMILVQAIVTNVVQIPSNFLSALIGETEFFGRKYTMVLGYVLSITFFILSIISPLLFYLFIGFSLFSLGISFSSANSYTCEVYPTSLRDTAVGFYNGIGRVMALLSTFIYFELEEISMFSPYVFSIGILLVSLISAFGLPFETRGKDLDSF